MAGLGHSLSSLLKMNQRLKYVCADNYVVSHPLDPLELAANLN